MGGVINHFATKDNDILSVISNTNIICAYLFSHNQIKFSSLKETLFIERVCQGSELEWLIMELKQK